MLLTSALTTTGDRNEQSDRRKQKKKEEEGGKHRKVILTPFSVRKDKQMNKETWKDIPGYAGLYQVSDLGRVRSLGRECNSKNGSKQWKKGRVLTQEVSVHGYCRIRLYDAEGKSKHFGVHRLVLYAFKGIKELDVNHLNEIKTDNRLSNLEYCTRKYNCNYGSRNKKISRKNAGLHSRPVLQVKDGQIVNKFKSRTEAEKQTGIDARHIGTVCSGNRKSAGGYEWRNA